MVSFVLPAYKAKFLGQAIESILSQTDPAFELIIVDDASPEHLAAIVDLYKDDRIRYYRNEVNIGGQSLVAQWNHCIRYARGNYIVLAADDDRYAPDFLGECVKLASRYPEVDLIRTGVKQIDEHNKLLGIDGILPERCSKYQFLYSWIRATTFTCIGNYMFKTSALLEKGFYDFPHGYGADVSTAVAMAGNGVANTSEMLFNFRISDLQLSSSKQYLKAKLEAVSLMYEHLMALNYAAPKEELDNFFYTRIGKSKLYDKCRYDYYHQVIKYLPFSEVGAIADCRLLRGKDKLVMLLRYSFDQVFRGGQPS